MENAQNVIHAENCLNFIYAFSTLPISNVTKLKKLFLCKLHLGQNEINNIKDKIFNRAKYFLYSCCWICFGKNQCVQETCLNDPSAITLPQICP